MALFERLLESRAISPQTLFRTGADTLDYGLSNAGVQVTADTALNYSGFWACVRLLASDISTLPVGAFRQVGETRRRLDPEPSWLELPDPFDPSLTIIDHIAQVAISLLLDGNAFILVTPDTVFPERLEVMNPRRVQVKKPGRTPEYHIVDNLGRDIGTLSPLDVLHVVINRKPGALRGMSPVEVNAGSIGISLAAQKYVERFFGQGAMMPGFVTVPVGSQTSAEELAADITKRHGGWRKSGLLGILTGGATYATTGISPRDAQLNEIFTQQLQEAAAMFGIPPFMVGSQEASGVAYASSVARSQDYIDHCLRHYVLPIERAYKRLVPGDRRLSSPGTDTFIKFNFDALLRGDTKSRFESHQIALSSRFAKVDQIRALEDWEPFGEENGGGFVDSPNNTAIDQRIEELVKLTTVGYEPAAAAEAVGLKPIAHTGLVPRLTAPASDIETPATPANVPTPADAPPSEVTKP